MNWAQALFIIEQLTTKIQQISAKLDAIQTDLNKIKAKEGIQ